MSQNNRNTGSGLSHGVIIVKTPDGYDFKPSPMTPIPASMLREDSQNNINVSAYHDSSTDTNDWSYSGDKDSSPFHTGIYSQSMSPPKATQSFTTSNQFNHSEGWRPSVENIYPQRNMNPEIRTLDMTHHTQFSADDMAAQSMYLPEATQSFTSSNQFNHSEGWRPSFENVYSERNMNPEIRTLNMTHHTQFSAEGPHSAVRYNRSQDSIGDPTQPLKIFTMRSRQGNSLSSLVSSYSASASDTCSQKSIASEASGYASMESYPRFQSPKVVARDIAIDRTSKSTLLYNLLKKSVPPELICCTNKNLDEIDPSGEPMVKSKKRNGKRVFKEMKEEELHKCGKEAESVSDSGPTKVFQRSRVAKKNNMANTSSHQALAKKTFPSQLYNGKQPTNTECEASRMKNTSQLINNSPKGNKKELQRRIASPARSDTPIKSTGYDEPSSDCSTKKQPENPARHMPIPQNVRSMKSKKKLSQLEQMKAQSKKLKASLETIGKQTGECPKSNDAKSNVKVFSQKKKQSFKKNNNKDLVSSFDIEDEHSIKDNTLIPIKTEETTNAGKECHTMPIETEGELSIHEENQFETDDEMFVESSADKDDHFQDENANDQIVSEINSDNEDYEENFHDSEYSEVVDEENLSQSCDTGHVGDLDWNTNSEAEEGSADTVKLAQSKSVTLSKARTLTDLTRLSEKQTEPRERDLITSDDLLKGNCRCNDNQILPDSTYQDQMSGESDSDESIKPIDWNEKVHSEDSIQELFSGDTYGHEEKGMIIKPEGKAVAFGVPPEIMLESLRPDITENKPANAEKAKKTEKKFPSRIPVFKKDIEFGPRPGTPKTGFEEYIPEMRLELILNSIEEDDVPEIQASEEVKDLYATNLEMERAYKKMVEEEEEQEQKKMPATDESKHDLDSPRQVQTPTLSAAAAADSTGKEKSDQSRKAENKKSLKIPNDKKAKAGGVCHVPRNRSPPNDKSLPSRMAPRSTSPPCCNIHMHNYCRSPNVSKRKSSPKRTTAEPLSPARPILRHSSLQATRNVTKIQKSSLRHDRPKRRDSSQDQPKQPAKPKRPPRVHSSLRYYFEQSDRGSPTRVLSPSVEPSPTGSSRHQHSSSLTRSASHQHHCSQRHHSTSPTRAVSEPHRTKKTHAKSGSNSQIGMARGKDTPSNPRIEKTGTWASKIPKKRHFK